MADLHVGSGVFDPSYAGLFPGSGFFA